MTQIILVGVMLLAAVLLSSKPSLIKDPKLITKHIPQIGAILALLGAALLMTAGRYMLALPMLLVGYYLLGRIQFPWLWTYTRNTVNGRTTTRTSMLEMVHEQRTGYMDGLVRSGRYGGRRLSELSPAEMESLLVEAHSRDPSTAELLEAYIRHTLNGGQTGSRNASGETDDRAPPRGAPSSMTQREAYDVLGLSPGATRDEIQQAHRSLMKRYHPDHGGTTYLASKINEAKDVLLR